MSSLPPALNFAETEEGICKKWKEENSFHQQNKLADERGDDVSEKVPSLTYYDQSMAERKEMVCCDSHQKYYSCSLITFFSIPHPHMTDRNSSFSMAHPLPQVYRIMDIFSQELLRTP